MSCQEHGHQETRRTLLVQKDIQAVLVAVLLELRVGDELGHIGDTWKGREGGRYGCRTGTPGVIGNK